MLGLITVVRNVFGGDSLTSGRDNHQPDYLRELSVVRIDEQFLLPTYIGVSPLCGHSVLSRQGKSGTVWNINRLYRLLSRAATEGIFGLQIVIQTLILQAHLQYYDDLKINW